MTLKELIVSLSGIMSVSGNERKNREALQALIGGVFDEYRTVASFFLLSLLIPSWVSVHPPVSWVR